MEDGTIPTDKITTNSNTGTADALKPNSDNPWSSDPSTSQEPEITVVLPKDAEITEVTLLNPDNVDSYTVTVTDSDGTSDTVILCFIG